MGTVTRWLAALVVVLAVGCRGGSPPRGAKDVTPSSRLPDALEAELAAIAADPADAIGSGEKVYAPYELRRGDALAHAYGPEVTPRLAAEAGDAGRPLTYRLAMLHIIALRDDAAADAALIAALDAPELRGTAAYGLGRMGFKGYPTRPRDRAAVIAALRRHTRDPATFADPWLEVTLRTQDLVLAACARVLGVEALPPIDGLDPEFLGYELPDLTDDARAALLAYCDADR